MNKPKILLIEDNPTLARQTGEFLQAHGWQIDFAHNGRLGDRLALEQIYDLVILDLSLPDIDGLEVCRQIKAQGFETGADDYPCKTPDPRELALRCRRHSAYRAGQPLKLTAIVFKILAIPARAHRNR